MDFCWRKLMLLWSLFCNQFRHNALSIHPNILSLDVLLNLYFLSFLLYPSQCMSIHSEIWSKNVWLFFMMMTKYDRQCLISSCTMWREAYQMLGVLQRVRPPTLLPLGVWFPGQSAYLVALSYLTPASVTLSTISDPAVMWGLCLWMSFSFFICLIESVYISCEYDIQRRMEM